MSDLVNEFNAYRERMNEKILADNNKIIKRIFNLDTNAYMEGALDIKTKELLGLVASTVLRCDDCIKYHLETCYNEGLSKESIPSPLSTQLGSMLPWIPECFHQRRLLRWCLAVMRA